MVWLKFRMRYGKTFQNGLIWVIFKFLLRWARRRLRVKRLASSICVCVCVQKTWLFTALLLEDCHEIALNSLVVNPRRMREGYGTCSVIRSFIHSFCPSSYRDHRSRQKLGKGMNRLSTTMACNVTCGFC